MFKQGLVPDGKSPTARVLSTMSEISSHLFTTLEAHFTVDKDEERSSSGNNASIQEQRRVFHERLNNIITSLGSTVTENEQDRSPSCSCEHKVVVWPQISRYQSSVVFLFCVLFLGYIMSLFRMLLL